MAEETEILLDSKLLLLAVPELTKFAVYLKVEKTKIEGQTKVKIIKAIRAELENNLGTFEGSDTDGQKNEYLNGLLKFLDENVTTKPSADKDNASNPSETDPEVENLENELKLIEQKQKSIQEKLLKTKKSGKVLSASGSSPVVIESAKPSHLLGLNTSLSSTILHRDFKIQGVIGEVGQKDKLGYQALMSQVEIGLEKGYADKEIITAVIRAVQPGIQLRSYLESLTGLNLQKLRKILRFHFKEKNATELYQSLTNMSQQPNEDAQAFLLRALTIRQKILFASKESDSGITYDSHLVQSLFLHALETGLKDETIRAKLRPLMAKADVRDEELIEATYLAVAAETERNNKFNLQARGKESKARVSTVQGENASEKKEILAAIKQVKSDLSVVQNEVKILRDVAQNQSENPNTSRRPSRKCDKCTSADDCKHCFRCGELNHIARYCRKGKQNVSGNGRRLPLGDKE